jgi:hypothetical protein
MIDSSRCAWCRLLVGLVSAGWLGCGPGLEDERFCGPVEETGTEPHRLDEAGLGCEAYADRSWKSDCEPIMVSIINARSEPVIVFDRLPGCGGLSGTATDRLYFSVQGEARGRLLMTPPDTCLTRWPACEALMRPDDPENSCRICLKGPAPRYTEAGGR